MQCKEHSFPQFLACPTPPPPIFSFVCLAVPSSHPIYNHSREITCPSIINTNAHTTRWPIWSDSWVRLTLIYDVPPTCALAQPVLPIPYQPKQNQAEGGTTKIKVNPTRLSDQMSHSVQRCASQSVRLSWPVFL